MNCNFNGPCMYQNENSDKEKKNENDEVKELFRTEITLDDGRTFAFEYVEDEYEFLIKEPFVLVKEDEDIIAMFNMNNVVSVIFD